jgi:hypothetical protein
MIVSAPVQDSSLVDIELGAYQAWSISKLKALVKIFTMGMELLPGDASIRHKIHIFCITFYADH